MSTMLSHTKKFIFIHNYKVAGSSISAVLARYQPHYWTRTILRKIGVTKYYPALANFDQHASALKVRKLVPEKVFEKGKTVSEKVIRGWEKTNDNEPRKLNITEISNNGILAPLLPDPSRKTETIQEKKVIDYQKGKLEIDSRITGSLMLDQSNNPNLKINTLFVFSLWVHEKVPFGTAAANWGVTLKRDGNILLKTKMTFTLEDFGTGAKSALPDQN